MVFGFGCHLPGLRGARAAYAALHGSDQVARAHRLEDEIVGAQFEHFQLALRVLVAGQEHHGGLLEARMFADLHREGGAAGARHVQVHQHQVRRELLHRGHHAFGRGDDLRQHARAAQDRFREQRLAAVILDDHDPVGIGLVVFGGRRFGGHVHGSPLQMP